MAVNSCFFNVLVLEYELSLMTLKQVEAVGRRSSPPGTCWMVNGGCMSPNPSGGGRSQDVTKRSSARREDGPPRRVYENVADLVADPNNPTPMVRLSSRFNPQAGWDMFVKLVQGLLAKIEEEKDGIDNNDDKGKLDFFAKLLVNERDVQYLKTTANVVWNEKVTCHD